MCVTTLLRGHGRKVARNLLPELPVRMFGFLLLLMLSKNFQKHIRIGLIFSRSAVD